MELKLEIKAEYSFKIEITNSILDVVARNYDGNFKSWARDNYKEHFNIDDMDLELEDCIFNKTEAAELLNKAREVIGSSDKDLNRVVIDREKLNHSLIEAFRPNTVVDLNALTEIEVDLDLLYKVLPFTALNNPKIELHYIHLINNTVEATDTRKLVKINNHKFSFNNILFPTYFLEPLKNGGKVFVNESEQLFLYYKDNYYKGIDDSLNKPCFPNTSGIIKDDICNSDIPKSKFTNSKIKKVSLGILEKDAYEVDFNGNKYYFQNIHFDSLKDFDIEFMATYNINPLHPEPFFFLGNDFNICLMPLLVDEYELIHNKE